MPLERKISRKFIPTTKNSKVVYAVWRKLFKNKQNIRKTHNVGKNKVCKKKGSCMTENHLVSENLSDYDSILSKKIKSSSRHFGNCNAVNY